MIRIAWRSESVGSCQSRSQRETRRSSQLIGWPKAGLSIWLAIGFSPCLFACCWQDKQEDRVSSSGDRPVLGDQQRELWEQYRQLEQKLFALHEFERENNPARSQLLQRAYLESQQWGTRDELQRIVGQLQRGEWREAETSQLEVLQQLQQLLALLQSEDRSQRVRDDLLRHREYLKEIERIQRTQRGLRGALENAGDGGRQSQELAEQQDSTARKTEELQRQIQAQEKRPGQESPAESAPPLGKGARLPPGNPGDLPLEPSQTPLPSPAESPENPVPAKLEAARQRMQQAAERLRHAEDRNALEEMEAAERELAEAKRQLEEILRQLREEEIGRALADLETRFRQMLERELKLHEQTELQDRTPLAERQADFLIAVGKLAVEQRSLAADAGRALLLLNEDGTSLALTSTVELLQSDMVAVTEQLMAAHTGELTQQLQNEIIESLLRLVDSIAQANRDREQDSASGGGDPAGQPGEQALVHLLAEIKLVRRLQEQIHRRHQRCAERLDDPQNPIGQVDSPEWRTELQKLAERQRELVEITRALHAKLKK